MSRPIAGLAFAAALLLAPSAAAQEEGCAGPFPLDDFVKGMNAADAALGEFDLDRYRAVLEQLEDKLPCTQEIVHPNHLTRFGRQKGLSAFFDQDEMTMVPWLTLSEVAGQAPFPAGLEDETHPFRQAIDELEEPWINGPEGAGVLPPKGGAILLNGRFLAIPEAAAETPNFVQVIDRRGLILESFWQEGSGFPSRYLVADPTPPEPPKWYVEPDPDVDPAAAVVLSEEEIRRQGEARAEAEAERLRWEREQEALRAQSSKDEAKAAKLAAKEAKKEAKRAEKERIKEEQRAAEAALALAEEQQAVVPEQWMDLSFDAEKAEIVGLDAIERVHPGGECGELVKMEPRALMGRLSADEITCLERELRHSERITEQDRISRVLMADAWAKQEPRRWESAMKRHLIEIDRSDADLCYIYARHLAKEGPARTTEALRWADRALEAARYAWNGDLLVKRRNALHRIKALAARQKWYEMEQSYLDNSSREVQARANYWRNYTKTAAREWMLNARDSGLETGVARELCISAAGSEVYCDLEG